MVHDRGSVDLQAVNLSIMRIDRPTLPLFLALALAACGGGQEPSFKVVPQEDLDLLAQAKNVFAPLPDTIRSQSNPVTPAKVALGRALYHDTRLSTNGAISCNSCHPLDRYGADGERTSEGAHKQRGSRNSPTVYNAALHSLQFWDGRAADVEQQAGMPVLNPAEMEMPDSATVVSRLSAAPDLAPLFAAAFPAATQPVSYTNMTLAIGAFERTLVTPGRFDRFLNGDAGALSAEEKAGLRTFMDVGCTTCHAGPGLGGQLLQKFGLLEDFRPLTGSTEADHGRMDITHSPADKDVFKSCGLRNVARTGPYFHDGSVPELDKAVKVMARAQLRKDLTEQQVKDLVAFLNALTGELPKDVMPATAAAQVH